jgi:PhzF family phenazine biosynthesis protein
MPRTRPFAQVDVFARQPYRGNPVAVILDADGLETSEMQAIARWTNLSETAFVLPPTSAAADYRVRIFTPGGELPFAGHPTLGSARAWLHHGGEPRPGGRIVQECGVGLVDLAYEGERLAFAAPPLLRTGELDDEFLGRITAAFGIRRDSIVAHQWVDNGPGWAVIRVATAEEVLAIDPDLSPIADAKVGVIGSYPRGSRHAFELRAFAPAIGIPEDPVTGSLNAAVAQWLTASGQAPDRYTVSQGTRLGRAGEIDIRVDDGTVWVGGDTTVCFTGSATA